MAIRAVAAILLTFCLSQFLCPAQAVPPPPAALPPVAELPPAATALHIDREVNPERPFSVVGPRGAVLGKQDGSFEAWIFPWKILDGMRITANMQDYPVPIEVNDHAADIAVTPAAATITYAHANFTIRQVMFAPKEAEEGTAVVVLYQIEAIRPMTLTFTFNPVMLRMWPAPSDPQPSPEWVKTAGSSGFYMLNENFPDHAAAVAIPTAEPGIEPPYQELARSWPLQLVVHFDPARDKRRLFPLLIALGNTRQTATPEALAHSLAALDAAVPSLYESNENYYRDLLAKHIGIDTPDQRLNAAFSWAIASIDQLRVQTPEHQGQALTAGFLASGPTIRPGFGWFFGRDALWTLYAVDSYGDFDTARQEFEFLLRHQRADGKIMHEYSQTANLVDWQSLPYEYAAADSTPLLLMAADDFLKTSGDLEFIRANWDALQRAWNFETSHVSADGIYNNSEGTGWVESWVPSMPQQEIYLAALDQQASTSFADLARATGHNDLAQQSEQRAGRIAQTIEKEYFLPSQDFYAFSHNANGTTDDTATIFPSVAWWDGTFSLDHPEPMMRRWASDEFSTDWGTRILSGRTSFYDPISYHQGSVWPLFTGWVALAEYRAGHPLEGYTHLMQNANLTWAQDLGDVTELLSGQFFEMLGRSTAHQLWSSAMVISPLLRGMFGLEWNAAANTLKVNPNLPADWNQATVRNIPLGSGSLDLSFTRRGQEWLIETSGDAGVHLRSDMQGARTTGQTLHIPLPPVEVSVPRHLPEPGAETRQLKVLDEQWSGRSLTLTLAGWASERDALSVRENAPGLHVRISGAEMGELQNGLAPVTVLFPTGDGYVTQTVTFSW